MHFGLFGVRGASLFHVYTIMPSTPLSPRLRWVLESDGPSTPLSRALRWEPPPCKPPVSCTGGPCRCSPEFFYNASSSATPGPALSSAAAAKLRVFFFDGHSGPLNDMTATLVHLGVPLGSMDAMLMAQAAEKRPFVDVDTHKVGAIFPPAVKREMRDFLRGNREDKSKDATLLPKCERKRCRVALYSDGLRREFAERFGAAFEQHVDVVACNFPTWQCSLFMYVRVAVVMRFTHRFDHHLQGYYVDPGDSQRPAKSWSELQRPSPAARSASLNASMAQSQRWRKIKGRGAAALQEAGLFDEMPAAAWRTVKAMAALPNVVLAASNPYDAM